MKAESILDTIGNTPHIRLKRYFPEHQVWLKLESRNPGGSIKDRIAANMIYDALKKDIINKHTLIVEPTSGNTGIGLAIVCAVNKIKLLLVMPETMTVERQRYILALGAEIVLTPKSLGMKGAIAKAEEIHKNTPNSWMPMQFSNAANPEIHRITTAQEIIADFAAEELDFLITGVGTGGHITGCAEVLKKHFTKLKVLAVEPDKSSVIAGKEHSPHKIQGIGAGFIPAVLNQAILDGTIAVSEEAAFEAARKIASTEGIFIGISSGASIAAVEKFIAESQPAKDKTILTFAYDTGERYLSISGLFNDSLPTVVDS